MRNFLLWSIWLLMAGNVWAQSDTPTGVTLSPRRAVSPAALPCADSSPECLALLGAMAVSNSVELKVLQQAVSYQKRRVWSSALNADGWNPLAVAFRLARNATGGGDLAAARLSVAQLEARRAEIEAALQQAVARAVFDLEAAAGRAAQAVARLEAHRARLALATVSYRHGEGSTEAMLTLWQAGQELRAQEQATRAEAERERRRLAEIVKPRFSGNDTDRLAAGKSNGGLPDVKNQRGSAAQK